MSLLSEDNEGVSKIPLDVVVELLAWSEPQQLSLLGTPLSFRSTTVKQTHDYKTHLSTTDSTHLTTLKLHNKPFL